MVEGRDGCGIAYKVTEGIKMLGVIEVPDPVRLHENLKTINTNVELLKPVQKTSLINQSVSANTDILSSDLSPSNTPCIFRIYVVPTGFTTTPVLSVIRKVGATTITEKLNNGSALNNDCAYMFDIVVDSGETINLQCDQAGTLAKLSVSEWYMSPG